MSGSANPEGAEGTRRDLEGGHRAAETRPSDLANSGSCMCMEAPGKRKRTPKEVPGAGNRLSKSTAKDVAPVVIGDLGSCGVWERALTAVAGKPRLVSHIVSETLRIDIVRR